MFSKAQLEHIGTLSLLAIGFVTISYFTRANEATITAIIQDGGAMSMISFIALTMLCVIFIIPLEIVFLIPLGAVVWGPIPTALMSITGWLLGSMVALGIARTFGAPIVGKMVGLEQIQAIETRIPKKNLFWTVVFLRLTVSVDILSYALGLFSKMPLRQYALATLIGVTPFGFYFSYAGTLSFWYQVTAMGGALILATAILFTYGKQKES